MPEHREGTPADLRDLESFLWRDLGTVETWHDWIEQRRFEPRLAPSSFDEARDLQESLRQLEAANNGVAVGVEVTEAMVRLNDAIGKHALSPRITADGVRVESRTGDPVGHILQLAIQAMSEGFWPRFKLCRDAACRASFFDVSKNGSKTWCSMELCGSRNKMRRLRERS